MRMTSNLKVLLVEDEPLQAILFDDIISEQGHQTTLARNGKDAANIILQNSINFDAVITDVEMRPGNGLLLVRHIRGYIKRPLPVLIHSSSKYFFSDPMHKAMDLEKVVPTIYPTAEFHVKDFIYRYISDFLHRVKRSKVQTS